jgi:hypothetical protein
LHRDIFFSAVEPEGYLPTHKYLILCCELRMRQARSLLAICLGFSNTAKLAMTFTAPGFPGERSLSSQKP